MLDWTDRHCRSLHRLLSPHARLYTEMVTTGALLHGDVPRHLDYSAEEHPVALQLGGSEPADLAACVKLAQRWGYDEVNLNCGCPSERVQRGAFGACLMAEPLLVRDCVAAMVDAAAASPRPLPVTVKHRIGIDRIESYEFVRDFVATVAEGGCQVFIVHARNAWLQGLSPKDNREIPPLRHAFVERLKLEFPHLVFVLNGGLAELAPVQQHLQVVDGVMIGRHAYHQPAELAAWDAALFGGAGGLDVDAAEAAYVAYMAHQQAMHATAWATMARHMLGLRHGQPGARRWRQVWSDHHLKARAVAEVAALAAQALQRPLAQPA
jgi:tRNA-dihydrouridine synthase A